MQDLEIRSGHVTPDGGEPELYIDGERYPLLLYALSDIPGARPWLEPSKTSIRQFAECGIDLVAVDTDLQSGWREDGSFDPSFALRELESTLESNPGAKLFIRLHLNPPYHWMHSHPRELIRFDGCDAPTDHGSYGDRVIQYDKYPEIKASIASKAFLRDAGDMLAKFCKAVMASPAGASVAAVQPAYGLNGEWHHFAKAGTDLGEAMTGYMRDRTREMYPTLAALREAYGPDADYGSIAVLPAAERDAMPRSRQALDQCRFMNMCVGDAVRHFCRIVKRTWPGILAGAFYGYYFSVGLPTSGMLEPQAVLTDPDIDFLAGPSAYRANKWPGNTPLLRYLPESARLNGKPFLCEMDQGPISWGSDAKRGLGPSYASRDTAEYISMMTRNIIENLMHGNGAWYYDHRLPVWDFHEKRPYWTDPAVLERITALKKLADARLAKPFVKNTDVLLVFDTYGELFECTAPDPDFETVGSFHGDTFGVFDGIHKSGASFDEIYLCDLPRVNLDRYRCVVFFNCGWLSEGDAAFIRSRVLRGGRTAVFCGRFAENLGGADAFPGGTALPRIPLAPAAWRDLFRTAGAHIYTEGNEVLSADGGLVMLHSCGIAESSVRLKDREIKIVHPGAAADTAVLDIQTGDRLL